MPPGITIRIETSWLAGKFYTSTTLSFLITALEKWFKKINTTSRPVPRGLPSNTYFHALIKRVPASERFRNLPARLANA